MSSTDEELDLNEESESSEPGGLSVVEAIAPTDPPELDEGGLSIPELLPILPVRDTVAFPGTIIPLNVGREKSKRLIDDVIAGPKILGVVAQRRAEVEDPTLDDLYRIGTVVAVLKSLKMSEGNQSVIVHGLVRFGLEDITQSQPYLVARAHTRTDTYTESTELEAMVETSRRQAARVIEMTPGVPDEAQTILANIEKPGSLADFLAANLTLDLVQKQEILETFDVIERLRKVNMALAKQISVLELSTKIQKEVKGQIDKSQREYYLQEQMRAIQKELGETDSREVELEELRQAVEKAKMPEEVRKEADRELDRLGRIPQASPEYSGGIDYMHWLCEIPWSISTEDNHNIARAEKVLDTDHHDLDKVKKRILEFLAVRKLKKDGRGPILCFAGPPGVGKTSLGRSIARALGRKFIRMSVGGVRDEAELRGHRRTYIGALPGRVMQEIRKAGANNPVFMLDEVDKLGSDFRGDPSSALLEVLDPEQNFSFQDNYLGVPFDLSRVMFICTANYMDAVPPPLRDRMEVIDIPGYTQRDKLFIAKQYLVPRRREQTGLNARQLKFTDSALETIIESYTAEAGVRNLEREIGSVCRGVAAQAARRRKHPSVISRNNLEAYLGPIKFEPELALRTSVPGVVTGLAWTPFGGVILFVEANSMPGKGQMQLTGQLGDVMRESVQAAYSLVRSNARKLGLDSKIFTQRDIHVHIPAGAVPKDGPSAGIAMYTALVSLLTQRPCRPDVAMTGEITLRGLVLPIGGLKAKTLAAHRAGIKTIIIPDRNKKDLVEVPAEVRKKIKFVPVKTVADVLVNALTSGKSKGTNTAGRSKARSKKKKNAKTKKPRNPRHPARAAARS